MRVRIVIHTGIAECRAGDYFGLVLSRLARLMSTEHGGQVVILANSRRALVSQVGSISR